MLNFVLFSLPNFNFPLEATFWYARAVFNSRFTNYLPLQTKLNKGNKYSNQKPFVYYTHFLSMIWCSLIQRQICQLLFRTELLKNSTAIYFLMGILMKSHRLWKTIVFFSAKKHNHWILQEFQSQFQWDSIKIPVRKAADFASFWKNR